MNEASGIHTYQEIWEQSVAWEATLAHILQQEEKIRRFFQEGGFREAIFIGCGSTYYLSLAAAAIFQALTGVRARALPASELLLFPESSLPRKEPALLVATSRSGETTETLRAVRLFKEGYGKKVLAIGCYEASKLMTCASLGLATKEAKERSVAQTRSFATMFLVAQLCAGIAAERPDYCNQLRALPVHGKRLMAEESSLIQRIGEEPNFRRFFFLGSGPHYGLACEAMLKMKEMSLSDAEAFHFLEFRHGPKSMVDAETLLIGLLSDSARRYEVALLAEMRGYGAKTLVLAEEGESGELSADYLVLFRSGLTEMARALLFMPLLQLLAYHRAMAKGLDPDRPRNLEPVVLLE